MQMLNARKHRCRHRQGACHEHSASTTERVLLGPIAANGSSTACFFCHYGINFSGSAPAIIPGTRGNTGMSDEPELKTESQLSAAEKRDLRLISQAVAGEWDIPEPARRLVPAKMISILGRGSNREATAAARVLAVLAKQNMGPVPNQHLHVHQPGAVHETPTEDMNLDELRARNRERIDRLQRLGRID